ncbi:unnamed protein product [Brachionus calyciflorus]|uniref:Uncharacterized protein n=1 Tax=Brachionus calyciflorus TaxID=104777 RepID=A0A813M4M1_9BILA|nr:unnamed protein product [Brachionus calyciflorus]
MPTCSQAKIITNLESDIHKKLCKLVNYSEQNYTEYSKDDGELTRISFLNGQNKKPSNQIRKSQSLRKFRTINDFKMIQEHQKMIHHQQPFTNSILNIQPKRLDDSMTDLKKLPYLERKDSVPVNFLYNSHYRGRNSLLINQIKIAPSRPEISKNVGSDGEEYEINTNSSRSNSDKSSISENNNYIQIPIQKRQSLESNQFIQSDSRRNSLVEESYEGLRRRNSLKNQLSYFPKLALEVESIETENSKKSSLDQTKRLLALASIRPSKTFHKSMTEQEIEVLKKYYEIIKPKVSLVNQQNQNEMENLKLETMPPLVYNTAKVNSSSLESVRSFLSTYQKDLELGLYKINYDPNNDPKCFVLKNKLDESIVKFPEELNDTFFALAASTTDRDRQSLGEANLYRIVNWNDTSVTSIENNNVRRNSKNILRNNQIERTNNENSKESPHSSSVSFDYIKNLTNLVSTAIEPKFLNQLTLSGVDVGVLPGGANFEMPTFEEMGINLDTIIKSNQNLNGEFPPINGAVKSEIQSSKLKNSAYKKLKEKVSKAKVMWFASPPERKPFSVIFENAGVDMSHETILDEANKYLKDIGGHVVSLEFVPRSVLLNSVYVENLWILNLSDNSTKFFTITNGLKIKDEIINCKSYDEFIFSEYENFIRNEKYKQLVKNHEKAIEKANRRLLKKSVAN